MTANRRAAGQFAGTVNIHRGIRPVKPSCGPHRCGNCAHFLVLNCSPDPPLYFCQSEQSKTLVPAIGWLRGPDALGCKFFATAVAAGPDQRRSGSLPVEQRFLTEPEQFIDAATTAQLLRMSKSSVYNLIQEGRLQSVRVGDGKIFIYRPSVLDLIHPNDAP